MAKNEDRDDIPCFSKSGLDGESKVCYFMNI